jgi:histidinol-phosphate aminotransferase
MPHYEAGLAHDAARERFGVEDVVKLASNESPWGPHPAVIDAVAQAAAGANRYPEQFSPTLKLRIAERHETEPGRVAVGNGSCELLLAACEALCEPGAELVFAWPSFSMYPHLAALSGAREIRVPLDEDGTHDLEAMLDEVTAATQLLLVCNPNNPTATHIPAAEVAAFVERVPQHVTVILDEAYAEFQLHDDPDSGVDLTRRFPNLVVLRTFSKVYGLAGLRCGYAIGSARFRAAVDAVRQPFSVNQLAQVAAAEALRHRDDVEDRVEQTVAARVRVESGEPGRVSAGRAISVSRTAPPRKTSASFARWLPHSAERREFPRFAEIRRPWYNLRDDHRLLVGSFGRSSECSGVCVVVLLLAI